MDKALRRYKICLTVIVSSLVVVLYFNILQFSSQPAQISTEQSISVSERIIGFIEKTFSINFEISADQFGKIEKFIRKAAHFSEYALLGFLVYMLPLIWERKTFKPALYSFIAVVIMASFDEFLQLFIPGRAALVTDVMLDAVGCVFGMLVLRLIYLLFTYKLVQYKIKSEDAL